MDFSVFKPKKKKPEPEAPAPIVPAASPKPPSTATPKPRRREAPPPQGPRPHMPGGDRGAYAEELDRMSRIPGMRNVEVTTSRTFRWNLRDPVDGRNYEHMPRALPTRPPQQLLGPPPEYQYGPSGSLAAQSHPHYNYGYGGAPAGYGYNNNGGYYGDEYPPDCSVM
ncbi:hypothetical protein M9H77_22135 [Catharanthus roseus]|uniref:Uncharacterized protein n=1 Tax=Catharanthus roseus TaxID=4058 RepID=A0ACC0AQU4_CATRO|nr:hypothetical protein M9H77_22135 [Catharanthus roseus]